MKKKILAVFLILTVACTISLSSCTSTENQKDTFNVGSSPAVEVSTGNGNVVLILGSDGTISVDADLRNTGKVDYEVSQVDDLIIVEAKTRSDSRADLTLTVPENTQFDLSTGNGNISSDGIKAAGAVNNGNGSIALEGVRGDVTVSLGNGDIRLTDAIGYFTLQNGNGSIEFQGELTPGSSSTFTLGNGNIEFQGELTPGSNSTFTLGNGDTTVELAGSPSVALDLETNDGEVITEIDVSVSHMAEGRLVGTIGNGEAMLIVDTGNGNITIK
jgi:hypothetical protein